MKHRLLSILVFAVFVSLVTVVFAMQNVDDVCWLRAAQYGEHDDLKSNKNRYTERFLEFMPNGGVRRLQRHGLKADGIYGKADMVLFLGGYATLDGGVTFHYYTQDYLGNNRAVINGSTGAIEQTIAYYPYGGVIADLGTPTKGQPYKFGGKELITANGLNEYDFGARYYYSAVPHFTKPDPLCEKRPDLSTYLYCGNDPVNNVDPTGMIWEDPKEADQLIDDINKKIASYQNQINKLNDKLNNGISNSKIDAQISDLNQRIEYLQKGISDIGLLGNDAQYTYSLSHIDGSDGHTVRLGDDGIVYIETSENALSIHEISHVRQSKEASIDGSLDFSSKGILKNPGTREKKHLEKYQKSSDAEIEAYQMQFAYDPATLPIKASNIKAIDIHFVGSIMNGRGQPVYPIIHEYSKYIKNMNKLNLSFP